MDSFSVEKASFGLSMQHEEYDKMRLPDIDLGLDSDLDLDLDWSWGITDSEITVQMLKKRRDIRETLKASLKEAFPEKYTEEEDIPDEEIVAMANMDPEVKATLIEILLELTDCDDYLGETGYYPSISEYKFAEDILNISKVIGFREEKEALPFKFEHLSSEVISLIYSNPHVLPIISRLKKESITEKFVRSLLTKK